MVNRLTQELQKPLVKYGLMLVVLLVVLQKVVVPWIEWRQDLSEQLQVTSSLLVDKQKLESSLAALELKQEALSGDLQRLFQSFSGIKATSAKVELPTQVRQICDKFDVQVNRIAVTELEPREKPVSSFMVSVETSGSVDALFALLSTLENAQEFFIVDRLTVYGRQGQAMKARLELLKHVSNE